MGTITKKIFKGILILLTLMMVVGISFALYMGVKIKPKLEDAKRISDIKLEQITDNTFTKLEDTIIYDNKDNIISEINAGNYEYVDIDGTSKWLIEGYIAVEDRKFLEHEGIDYKAIVRAGLDIIKNKGKVTQGGSTITQQVIKNNLLTQEKTLDRKLIEFFLAPELEKMYSKNDIMEFYLNTNSYGNNCEGIGSASRYYFNKNASELTIEESALLVGISNNPTKYNPRNNKELAKEKRDLVLKIMLDQNVINENEYKESLNKDIELELFRENRGKESYLTSYAIHSATLTMMKEDEFEFKYIFNNKDEYDTYKENYNNIYSQTSDKVRGGGYEIYTTLDIEKQSIIQEKLDNELSGYTSTAEDGRYAMQGSSVLINNSTGNVEAIVGGRGTEDEFNRGFLGVRQPGSAIKPIISFGPAYDTGKYYPSKKIKDEHIKDGPKNAGGRYRGKVSMRDALTRSINTISYKILEDIGTDKGLEYLSKLEFGNLTYIDNNNKSLSLGGFTYGATVLDMAKAYSTIVNYGKHNDAGCIRMITFQDGTELYSGYNNYTQVYTKETSYMLLDNLQNVIESEYGTGRSLKLNGMTSGGKTGTTNQQKDAWFAGVTPYYTMVVWCGYDNPKPTNMYGSGVPGQIWKKSMDELHKDLEDREFKRPPTIVEKDINWDGERVNYNSKYKDIFSKVHLDNERRLELQRIEEERLARERAKITEIKFSIDMVEDYINKGNIEISELYKKVQRAEKALDQIDGSAIKSKHKNNLEKIKGEYSMALYEYEKELIAKKKEEERIERELKELERIEREKIEQKERELREEREKQEAEQKMYDEINKIFNKVNLEIGDITSEADIQETANNLKDLKDIIESLDESYIKEELYRDLQKSINYFEVIVESLDK